MQNDPVNYVDPTGLDGDGECKDEQGNPVDCGPPVPPEDIVRIRILDSLLRIHLFVLMVILFLFQLLNHGSHKSDRGTPDHKQIPILMWSIAP